MSPFGAIDNVDISPPYTLLTGQSEGDHQTKIEFLPERQILHDKASFAIVIEDERGIPDDFKLSLTYNEMDLSQKFLKSAKRDFVDGHPNRLKLTARNIRLLPTRDNRIEVSYQRTPSSLPRRAQYKPPQCAPFSREDHLKAVSAFDVDELTVKSIDYYATQKGINPHYVAGLIAQESSFDPIAMSRDRALGLMQVTPLGQAEILRHARASMPRYPGIDKMPLWQLKMGILDGDINKDNEWRLDPERSILGGVEYLAYLKGYWSRPSKREILKRAFGDADSNVGDVILASYNSGPARVSKAIRSKGKKWLNDDQLGEAKKYVWRAVSYCDHFGQEEK